MKANFSEFHTESRKLKLVLLVNTASRSLLQTFTISGFNETFDLQSCFIIIGLNQANHY